MADNSIVSGSLKTKAERGRIGPAVLCPVDAERRPREIRAEPEGLTARATRRENSERERIAKEIGAAPASGLQGRAGPVSSTGASQWQPANADEEAPDSRVRSQTNPGRMGFRNGVGAATYPPHAIAGINRPDENPNDNSTEVHGAAATRTGSGERASAANGREPLKPDPLI
jgi:hypothetical protein